MEQLILYLSEPCSREMLAQWALFADGRKLAASEEPAFLSGIARDIPAAGDNRRVIALIPGQHVLLTSVAVPPRQRRHLRRILPYLIEDQLAEDVELLHLAKAARMQADALPVAVVRKSAMMAWREALSAAGLAADEMLPDSLAIPHREGTWSLLYTSGSIWLRTGVLSAFAVEPILFTHLLGQLLGANKAPPQVECYFPQTDREAALTLLRQVHQDYPSLSLTEQAPVSVFDIFCAGYLERQPMAAPHLNLLQGEFAARNGKSASQAAWRTLAGAAAAWFILQMLLDGSQAAYFSYKADDYRAQSTALYRKSFPQDGRIVDPLQQMKAHLSSTAAMGPHGFLPALRLLGAHWRTDGAASPEMDSIGYREDDHALIAGVIGKDLESLNSLAQRLNARGISATLLSVVSGKDGVKGQLSVKDTEGE